MPVIDLENIIDNKDIHVNTIIQDNTCMTPYHGSDKYDDITSLLKILNFHKPKVVFELSTAHGNTVVNILGFSRKAFADGCYLPDCDELFFGFNQQETTLKNKLKEIVFRYGLWKLPVYKQIRYLLHKYEGVKLYKDQLDKENWKVLKYNYILNYD